MLPCLVSHVSPSVLLEAWMSQVMLWAVYSMQRLCRLDAWTQPQDCESADAFQSQIPWVSLERDLTEKSHKTSFKGHIEIACLSSTTSSSPPPLPHLTPYPTRLHSYIRWMRWRHASRKEGMGTFASHSLEGLWDCLHLDGLSVARGLSSPDGLSTVPASFWFSSPAPASGLQPRCVPSVPGGNPGWSAPSLGNLPAGAPLIRVDTPGVATGRPAAPSSHPGEPASGLEQRVTRAEFTWAIITFISWN